MSSASTSAPISPTALEQSLDDRIDTLKIAGEEVASRLDSLEARTKALAARLEVKETVPIPTQPTSLGMGRRLDQVPNLDSPKPLEIGMQVICPSRNSMGGTLVAKRHPMGQVTLNDGRKYWFPLSELVVGDAPKKGKNCRANDADEEEAKLTRCKTLVESQKQLTRMVSNRVEQEQKTLAALQQQFGGTTDQAERAKVDQLMERLQKAQEQQARDEVLSKSDHETLDKLLAKVQRRNRLGIDRGTPSELQHLDPDQLSRQTTTTYAEEQAIYNQRQNARNLQDVDLDSSGAETETETEAETEPAGTTAHARTKIETDRPSEPEIEPRSESKVKPHYVQVDPANRFISLCVDKFLYTGLGAQAVHLGPECIVAAAGRPSVGMDSGQFAKDMEFVADPGVTEIVCAQFVKLVIPGNSASPLVCRLHNPWPENHAVQLILQDGSVSPYVKVYQLEDLTEDELRAATHFLRAIVKEKADLDFPCPGAGYRKGLALSVFGEDSYPIAFNLPATDSAQELGLTAEALCAESERMCAL